jgi:GNAT superfamily N-acetyltransferase
MHHGQDWRPMAPRQQAGHMTASDLIPSVTLQKSLQAGGHPHMRRYPKIRRLVPSDSLTYHDRVIRIRVASMADCRAVEAIVQAAYAPYVPRIGHKPGPMLDDYPQLIRGKRVYVLVVEEIIFGILVLVSQERSMLLDNIAVSPEVQRRGYGRMLLEFAEHCAADAGYDSISLYTNEAMVENIALYSRIGFIETHRAEEKGLHRVYMTKSLR